MPDMETVWDLHFVDNGIADIATIGLWLRQRSGVVYHVFATEAEAREFAAQTTRKSVVQCRQWHIDFLDSPFVTDHRRAAHGQA